MYRDRARRYALYHKSLREDRAAVLTIGNDRYWLLSYQVPNQGRKRRKCADLLALSVEGGLVVFECKAAAGTGPLSALYEGLDYLACLACPQNFARILRDFSVLRMRLEAIGKIPVTFANIEPRRNVQHGVILLAPNAYFQKWGDWRWAGSSWRHAADRVLLGFAAAEIDDDCSFAREIRWA